MAPPPASRLVNASGAGRVREELDDYGVVRDVMVEELGVKAAKLKVGERREWIPYSLMHEDDMARLSEGAAFDELRVQRWLMRKKGL